MNVREEQNDLVTTKIATRSRNICLQIRHCDYGSLWRAIVFKDSGIATCVSRWGCEDDSHNSGGGV